MKRLVLVIGLALSGCYGPKVDMGLVHLGMTKEEITQFVGREPEGFKLENGLYHVYYKVRDGNFGNYTNHYDFAFSEGRLIGFVPLPEEEGPIDKMLKLQHGTVNHGSEIITPNAYGPGLHSDQYGRPVRIVPQ